MLTADNNAGTFNEVLQCYQTWDCTYAGYCTQSPYSIITVSETMSYGPGGCTPPKFNVTGCDIGFSGWEVTNTKEGQICEWVDPSNPNAPPPPLPPTNPCTTCGTGNPPPPPPPTTNPCATAKAAKSSAAYNAKVADLKNYTTGNIEHGWFDTQDANGSYSYKSANSTTTNPDEIDFTANSFISDMLHNHFAGQNSTFDGQDIATFCGLYVAGKMNNILTFSSTVVTPSGTYMMVVSDPGKFNSFANDGLNGATIDQTLQVYGYYIGNSSTPASNAQQELSLARFFASLTGGTGLTLMKLDTSGNFNQLNYDSTNNQVKTTNCNN